MKKILSLVLVLAVAQFASAAVSWSNVDNGDGTFTVTMADDANVTGVFMYSMTSSGPSFAVTATNWAGAFTSNAFQDISGAPYNVAGGYGQATASVAVVGSSVTGTLVTFDVAGAAGDVLTIGNLFGTALASKINYLDGSSASLTGTSFTLVPEPMTMALLGLGGLFVRRRKA